MKKIISKVFAGLLAITCLVGCGSTGTSTTSSTTADDGIKVSVKYNPSGNKRSR